MEPDTSEIVHVPTDNTQPVNGCLVPFKPLRFQQDISYIALVSSLSVVEDSSVCNGIAEVSMAGCHPLLLFSVFLLSICAAKVRITDATHGPLYFIAKLLFFLSYFGINSEENIYCTNSVTPQNEDFDFGSVPRHSVVPSWGSMVLLLLPQKKLSHKEVFVLQSYTILAY